MKTTAINLLSGLLIILSSGQLIAQSEQKQFRTVIKFSNQYNKKDIRIFYDNGIDDNVPVKFDTTRSEIELIRPYSSKYGTIIVGYRQSKAMLWVGQKPAVINFISTKSSANVLTDVSLQNAWFPEGEQALSDFAIETQQDIDNFTKLNPKWFQNDSLIAIYEIKSKALSDRKIDYVAKHGNSYYSIWIFRRELVFANYNIDSLMNIFETTLSPRIDDESETDEIRKRLYGRNLKRGKRAADFEIKDIANNEITLKGYEGKHLLMVFWATWCTPCVEELPQIKSIRKRFSEDKLALLFVTLDQNYSKFQNFIKANDMTWDHAVSDLEILKRYGILAIPQVYLIDPTGVIIYSREEEKDLKLDHLANRLESEIETRP